MKAMIFAAGLGTRLRPLTDRCPKALIDVGGEPMLGRIIRNVIKAGITEVVINVHHLPDMVIDYIHNNDDFGISIHISDERNQLLDTGGGLLAARHLLDGDEPIMLHNADIFTDISLASLALAHQTTHADISLLVWKRDTSRAFLFDSKGRMHGWQNKTTGETLPAGIDCKNLQPLAFGGIHIVSPEIFPALEKFAATSGPIFSITQFYLAICADLQIRSYTPETPFIWTDIGKPESLKQLRSALNHKSNHTQTT